MQHQLSITKFGPLRECEISLNEMLILIGPQASGKSTISKLFYFFLHLRDEFARFCWDQPIKADIPTRFGNLLKERFSEFFGPIYYAPDERHDIRIRYTYADDSWLELSLDESRRQLELSLSPLLLKNLQECQALGAIEDQEAQMLVELNMLDHISESSDRRQRQEDFLQKIRASFHFSEELLFIPASRSLVSILLGQLLAIDKRLLDFPMREFITIVNAIKVLFGLSMSSRAEQLNKTGLLRLAQLQKQIMRGEYVHDGQSGRLYLDQDTYISFQFASSGQQESVWILQLLFFIAVQNKPYLVFVEEPEAHLFPEAQKLMAEVFCLLHKEHHVHFVLSTHSPYILSAINNHLYAHALGTHKLGQAKPEDVDAVLSRTTWLDFEKTSAFYLGQDGLLDLRDHETLLINADPVDSASNLVNQEYERLLNLEFPRQLENGTEGDA